MDEEALRRIREHLGEEEVLPFDEEIHSEEHLELLMDLYGLSGARCRGAEIRLSPGKIHHLIEAGLIRISSSSFISQEMVIDITPAGHSLRRQYLENEMKLGDVLVEEIERRRKSSKFLKSTPENIHIEVHFEDRISSSRNETEGDSSAEKFDFVLDEEAPAQDNVFDLPVSFQQQDAETPEDKIDSDQLPQVIENPAEVARAHQDRLRELTNLVVKTHMAVRDKSELMFMTMNHADLLAITPEDIALLETITNSGDLVRIAKEAQQKIPNNQSGGENA